MTHDTDIPNHSILGRLAIWGAFALVLAVAPLVFTQSASISFLSQMGTVMIFALSYNMLLGQGGMLSFGHAVYSGLGAFGAVHVMNWVGEGYFSMPVSLIPLVGGVTGMFFGVLFGYVTTKKAGVVFAMITLGIGELVFASTMMLPRIFGGEGGITTNRVIGEPVLGISYAPQIEVYYLITVWLFISMIAMYAYAHTPLGRLSNAVRDNPERVEFIGFSTHWVRYLTLIVSSFFAGISGALAAINFEIVSSENVSIALSGMILLFTFIGGTAYFYGPLIGAVVGTFLTAVLSGYTSAWHLYLGLFFILVVMFVPGGIASLFDHAYHAIRQGRVGQVWKQTILFALALLAVAVGTVMAVEMLYHITLTVAGGTQMPLFGTTVDTANPLYWIIAAVLVAAGVLGARRIHPMFREAWEGAVPGGEPMQEEVTS